MKILSAISEPIVRVNCSFCDEDHVVDFAKSKIWDKTDPDDACFYVKFHHPTEQNWWLGLRERIRQCKYIWDNDAREDVLLNSKQLTDLYWTLFSASEDFLGDDGCRAMRKFPKIENERELAFFQSVWKDKKKEYEHPMPPLDKPGKFSAWYQQVLFMGSDSEKLVLSVQGYDDIIDGKLQIPGSMTEGYGDGYIDSFNLGWAVNPKMDKSDRRRAIKYWLLKQSKYYFREFELSLTLPELTRFLACLNFIVFNLRKTEEKHPREYIKWT